MPTLTTESIHSQAVGLDASPDVEVLERLLDGQIAALQSVRGAIPAIASAAEIVETALRGGGRLVYAGAGSSALMANADGMELAGTFGIDPNRIFLCMAGGLPTDAAMPGDTEDDTDQADKAAASLGADDAVIVVTASGRTPFAVRFAQLAKAAGAKTICIANNPGAEVFAHADVAICLPTPPEVIAGSTRLGAGSAQKVTLNLLSTLTGVRLGHIHDGMMVNLRPDNDKLRARATQMVMSISGASQPDALKALGAADWSVKIAVLLLCGAPSADEARNLLNQNGDRLRGALLMLKGAA